MRIVVDQIVDGLAILDVDGEMMDFPLEALPEGIREGDVVAFVKVDNAEIMSQAQARIDRMSACSGKAGDVLDL